MRAGASQSVRAQVNRTHLEVRRVLEHHHQRTRLLVWREIVRVGRVVFSSATLRARIHEPWPLTVRPTRVLDREPSERVLGEQVVPFVVGFDLRSLRPLDRDGLRVEPNTSSHLRSTR